jgi:hypothetical protein
LEQSDADRTSRRRRWLQHATPHAVSHASSVAITDAITDAIADAITDFEPDGCPVTHPHRGADAAPDPYADRISDHSGSDE